MAPPTDPESDEEEEEVIYIPGTSSSAINFQTYLLDGIVRWNELRSCASVAPGAYAHLTPTDVTAAAHLKTLILVLY